MHSSKDLHTFTRMEIYEAEHLFAKYLKRYFGEVWRIPSDGQYSGVSWDCTSPLLFDTGLWQICQTARHKGALRGAGRIERLKQDTILRFILFYERKIGPELITIVQ